MATADHFARMGFAPRPWLEPEALQERFCALSSSTHPDKAAEPLRQEAGARFAELNLAWQTLRQPRARILHLLELLGLEKPAHIQNVPEPIAALFATVAQTTHEADQLLRQKEAATASPMLKVAFFERALLESDKIQQTQSALRARLLGVEQDLRQISQGWPEQGQPPSQTLARLQSAAAELGFLDRWSAQLAERLGALIV